MTQNYLCLNNKHGIYLLQTVIIIILYMDVLGYIIFDPYNYEKEILLIPFYKWNY